MRLNWGRAWLNSSENAVNCTRALAMGFSPSASTKIKSRAAAAAGLQRSLKGVAGESRNDRYCAQGEKTGKTGLQRVRQSQELIL